MRYSASEKAEIIRLVPLHKDYDSFVGCALMLAGSG
jgi:hypothetical protein